MLKWIKRFFGLDYDDKPNTHSGVGYSGETEVKSEPSEIVHNGVGHLGVQIETVETPSTEPVVNVVSAPIKEKKPRKPAVKKAAPKKTTKKK